MPDRPLIRGREGNRLAASLVEELTTDDIVEVNGDKWIVSKRHKTGIPFQVKLMDVPLQIIDRYRHLQEDKLVFGKMNYWSMCKKLKKVIAVCGIDGDWGEYVGNGGLIRSVHPQ